MQTSQLFHSKFFKAEDVVKPLTVTIRSVEQELIGPEKQLKGVLYVNESDLGLVLNKTNSDTISESLGDETQDWLGHKIVLYRASAQFNGKKVLCIRVRCPDHDIDASDDGLDADVS